MSPRTAYSDDQARSYDETRFRTEAGLRIHRAELAQVTRALAGIPRTARILEVGCGTGRILLELVDRGYRVDGADASPAMLRELRDKLRDRRTGVTLALAGAAHLPFADDSYDAAYSIRLLNQTGSEAYALSIVDELVRIVRPGGPILVEFVNAHRPRRRLHGSAVRLTPAAVIDRARAAGAQVVDCTGAFFLGMGALLLAPNPLVAPIDFVDRRLLSRAFPRACARCYVLARKSQ